MSQISSIQQLRSKMASVDSLISKLRQSKNWTAQKDMTPFHNFIAQLFDDCCVTLTILSNNPADSQSNNEAERLVTAILEAREHWKEIFPEKIESFGRDIFWIGGYHVDCVQFFQPVDFYANVPLVKKLFRWSVYDTRGEVVLRYYLEYSGEAEKLYLLALTHPKGYKPIQPFELSPPSYAEMKAFIIRDMIGKGPPPVFGFQYENVSQ